MTNQQKADLSDVLVEIERRYRQQAAVCQVAWAEGHITIAEYLEALERSRLAREAVEEWQRCWLKSLQKGDNRMDDQRIELLTVFEQGIPRAKIVERLWGLRRELEGDGALDLTRTVLLYDVAVALGLELLEVEHILGTEATRQVEKWKAEIAETAQPEPVTVSA